MKLTKKEFNNWLDRIRESSGFEAGTDEAESFWLRSGKTGQKISFLIESYGKEARLITAMTPIEHDILKASDPFLISDWVAAENSGLRGCKIIDGFRDNKLVLQSGFTFENGTTLAELEQTFSAAYALQAKAQDILKRIPGLAKNGHLDRELFTKQIESRPPLKPLILPKLFTGNPLEVFKSAGQLFRKMNMKVENVGADIMRVSSGSLPFPMVVKCLTAEPMITAYAPLFNVHEEYDKCLAIARSLNGSVPGAHFEFSPQFELFGVASYLSLTNEILPHQLGYLVHSIVDSVAILNEHCGEARSA